MYKHLQERYAPRPPVNIATLERMKADGEKIAAITAYAIGITTVRPSMLRAGMLAQQLAQAAQGGEREARMAEIGRLRGRAASAGRVVLGLLLFAAVAMAVARYL